MSKVHLTYIAIIVALVGLMLGAWYKRSDLARRFVPPPAPEIKIEYKERVVEKVKYIPRPALERKDLLPESVKTDPDKEVTAVATIPEHDGDTTAIAVIDTDTGQTSIEIRQERPSLFELSNIKAIGIRYDVNKNGVLYGSYEFLRIGAFHVELYGEINNENRAFAGLGLEYRW